MSAPSSLHPCGDRRAWTQQVFAAGDHAGAAMYGDPAALEHHAARALVVGDEASLRALADFAAPEARLYRGAARWIAGDTEGAVELLRGSPLPHARQLLRLIGQPRIRVLAQLPGLRGAATDLLGGAAGDPHFEIRNIGHGRGDAQNQPYTDVRRFLGSDFAPDFYVAAMAEWHHLPPNLQSLSCPLFAHVADHDLHAQTLFPWLSLFDEVCVTDRTEWLDVRGLVRGAVSSFPKVFGLPADLPPLPNGERHLDFFVSGTMLDPYHPDKARLLHELLSMRGIDLRVVRGFAGTSAYQALLAASKVSFTYVRRAGAMPTRGLEALAMGCAIALQEESVMNLFVGPPEGAATYGPRSGSLADAVRRLLDGGEATRAAAAAGAARVRQQFAMPRVASQYLRYLTFRAAAPRAQRAAVDTAAWCQKRLCVGKAWLPENPVTRRRTMQANFRHQGDVFVRQPSAGVLLGMARELLCEFAHYAAVQQDGPDERAYFDDAVRLLEQCCERFPDHLVPRCVLIRALLHHGSPRQRMLALQQAYDTLEVDPARWQVDPTDDVMPFDWFGECFDHRSYLDLVLAAHRGERIEPGAFAALLLAAIAGYVARKTNRPELHEVAATLAPAFARYRLDWARSLVERGGPAGLSLARTLLVDLAEGSTEFVAASRLLQRVAGEEEAALAAVGRALLPLRRFDEDAIDASVAVASLFAWERRAVGQARRFAASPGPSEAAAAISVLVPDAGSERQLAALLTDLECQTIAARVQVVVALAADGRDRLAGFAATPLALHVVDLPAGTGHAQALNACVAAAAAPLLTVAMPGDRFRPDALAVAAAEFDACAEVGLVFASEGWTAAEVARFEPRVCAAVSCPPPFGHRRLLTTNAVGLHPFWRRALHDRHGPFEPAFGCAAEYEFWLRTAPHWEVRQLRTLLSSSLLHGPWRAARDPLADPGAAERALAWHAGTSEERLPPFRPQRPLAALLFAPGLAEEAESHARLGILDEDEAREVRSLEAFYGTALMHGDYGTALVMLRTASAKLPDLLSPRLAEARLREGLGAPGVREVLQAARQCRPYPRLVDRLLAALPVADQIPAGAARGDT